MIKKAKGLELMKVVIITLLRTFDSKLLLTLRNMNFENVLLTKA
jgi:hypothetical protein